MKPSRGKIHLFVVPKYKRPQIFIEQQRRGSLPMTLKNYSEKPTVVQVCNRRTRFKDPGAIRNFEMRKHRYRKPYRKEQCDEKYITRSKKRGYKRKYVLQRKSESLPPPRSERKMKLKGRSVSAKPRYETRYVSVSRSPPKEPLSRRCANCFYRVCCQFYCYLTCIGMFTFCIIYVL
ncbi:uncharacterized protein LOC114241160 [Bombyx mandarina]|uniref:Uncharacterized protein LOC114241160 n=1 Tax=Bombyx mandarina TaxID=7092 RepID=A0A6J2JE24_BOMMA|nr:uncharacterized protein LOC114241160 [Bombyx mandarina]